MVSVHANLHVQACFQLEVGQIVINETAASSRVRPPQKTGDSVRRGISRPLPKESHDSVRPLLQSKHQRLSTLDTHTPTTQTGLNYVVMVQTESVPSVSS
jgi:hypothetical protein